MDWKQQLVRNLADALMGPPHCLPMDKAYELAFAHYSRTASEED